MWLAYSFDRVSFWLTTDDHTSSICYHFSCFFGGSPLDHEEPGSRISIQTDTGLYTLQTLTPLRGCGWLLCNSCAKEMEHNHTPTSQLLSLLRRFLRSWSCIWCCPVPSTTAQAGRQVGPPQSKVVLKWIRAMRNIGNRLRVEALSRVKVRCHTVSFKMITGYSGVLWEGLFENC